MRCLITYDIVNRERFDEYKVLLKENEILKHMLQALKKEKITITEAKPLVYDYAKSYFPLVVELKAKNNELRQQLNALNAKTVLHNDQASLYADDEYARINRKLL